MLEQVEEAPGGLAERQFAEDGQDGGAPAAAIALSWLPAQHVRDKIDFPSESRYACNFTLNWQPEMGTPATR